MAAELPSVCSSEIRRRQGIRCPEQAPALDRPVHTWRDSWQGTAGPGAGAQGTEARWLAKSHQPPQPATPDRAGSLLFHDDPREPQSSRGHFRGYLWSACWGPSHLLSPQPECPGHTANKGHSWGRSQGLLPQGLRTRCSLCWEHPALAPKASSPQFRRHLLQEAFPDPPAP